MGSIDRISCYHVVSRIWNKLKRPLKLIAVGKIIAASEGIDEGVVLKQSNSILLGFTIVLIVVLNSKDFYSSLSTQRQSIDKSFRADVNYTRYQFEVGNADRICWVPRRLNLADAGTKSDNSLTQPLHLLLFFRGISFFFPELEASNTKDKPLA